MDSRGETKGAPRLLKNLLLETASKDAKGLYSHCQKLVKESIARKRKASSFADSPLGGGIFDCATCVCGSDINIRLSNYRHIIAQLSNIGVSDDMGMDDSLPLGEMEGRKDEEAILLAISRWLMNGFQSVITWINQVPLFTGFSLNLQTDLISMKWVRIFLLDFTLLNLNRKDLPMDSELIIFSPRPSLPLNILEPSHDNEKSRKIIELLTEMRRMISFAKEMDLCSEDIALLKGIELFRYEASEKSTPDDVLALKEAFLWIRSAYVSNVKQKVGTCEGALLKISLIFDHYLLIEKVAKKLCRLVHEMEKLSDPSFQAFLDELRLTCRNHKLPGDGCND